jgi:hypothetical protein
MELSFSLLSLLIAAAMAVAFWRDALRQRDVANAAAIEACERLNLQFLDGTAAFTRWRVQRESGGWFTWSLRRVYVFDYTAQSIERRQGFVVMLGGRVESVGFAASDNARKPMLNHPVINTMPTVNITMTYGSQQHEPQQPSIEATPSESADADAAAPAKVFDLDEWRRTHSRRKHLH